MRACRMSVCGCADRCGTASCWLRRRGAARSDESTKRAAQTHKRCRSARAVAGPARRAGSAGRCSRTSTRGLAARSGRSTGVGARRRAGSQLADDRVVAGQRLHRARRVGAGIVDARRRPARSPRASSTTSKPTSCDSTFGVPGRRPPRPASASATTATTTTATIVDRTPPRRRCGVPLGQGLVHALIVEVLPLLGSRPCPSTRRGRAPGRRSPADARARASRRRVEQGRGEHREVRRARASTSTSPPAPAASAARS